MKLIEIPVNTLVELRFNYLDGNYKVNVGLLYKNANAVYVSAIRRKGKTIPASKLKQLGLIFKTDMDMYLFKNLTYRMMSYNGQNLYVLETDQEGIRINQRKNYRLFIGQGITARVTLDDNSYNMKCMLRDISTNGMSILTTQKIDSRAVVEISFRANDSLDEILTGTIVHEFEFKNHIGFLYGCEFDEPNLIISKYIAKQQEVLVKKS